MTQKKGFASRVSQRWKDDVTRLTFFPVPLPFLSFLLPRFTTLTFRSLISNIWQTSIILLVWPRETSLCANVQIRYDLLVWEVIRWPQRKKWKKSR